ncbi:MAG: hypothetical protein ACR2HD_11115 [Solirubrobacteraceae bacterium]|nr:MAG: hypothetical protein DLM63_13080 [Solirubrobacterales bacterium]
MLASITPLGERARRSNWLFTVLVYVVGSLGGGTTIAALAGAAGSLALGGVSWQARIVVVAAVLAIGLAWEVLRAGVPGPRRQVNERWLKEYRGWVYGVGFGAQLGAGVVTVVMTSSVYVVLVAAFASGQWQSGALIGAVAGALRGATVLAAARVRTPSQLVALHARMDAWRAPIRSGSLVTQLVLSVLAIALVAS